MDRIASVASGLRHGRVHAQDAIELAITVVDSRLRVVVSDDGAGFEARPIPAPTTTPESGRGLMLVDALADAWGVRQDVRTHVWFELGLGEQTHA